jgi:drug/metabolite transporter (DMT)-like permease
MFIPVAWVVIIAAAAPFMIMALSVALRNERMTAARFLGIVVGLAGVAVMAGLSGLDRNAIIGLALALTGALAFAAGAVLMRGRYEAMPARSLNFWMSLSGGIMLLPAMLTIGGPSDWTVSALLSVGWLALAGGVLGMGQWFILMRSQDAATAASHRLLHPVFGLLLAFLVIGERITSQEIIGALLIGVGLLISALEHRPAIPGKSIQSKQAGCKVQA